MQYRVQVMLINIRQVDVQMPDGEMDLNDLEAMAVAAARREFGDCDEADLLGYELVGGKEQDRGEP